MQRAELQLTELEARDTPAAFDPGFYAAGFQPIPGWSGVVVTAVGDFDGNGSVDTAYAAGPDGAPRVRVYSGGRVGEPPVPVVGDPGPQARPGETIVQPSGAGDVIFDGFVFEESFRGGADITTVVAAGDGPDLLVLTPGVGGGPRVRLLALDGSVDRSFLAFEESYRGGLFVTQTTVAFEVPADPHRFGIDLLVLPKSGGAPVAAAFDATGRELARFLVGPADDRRPYSLLHADVDVPGELGHRGLYVVTPDGRTAAFDWTGREFAR